MARGWSDSCWSRHQISELAADVSRGQIANDAAIPGRQELLWIECSVVAVVPEAPQPSRVYDGVDVECRRIEEIAVLITISRFPVANGFTVKCGNAVVSRSCRRVGDRWE